LEGEEIEETRDFLECEGGALGWDHQDGGCVFGVRVFSLAAALFLELPAASLVAAVYCGLGFLGLAVLSRSL